MADSYEYIDFIDGALDSESEAKFAERFAADDDFRAGFKAYLTITTATKNFKPSLGETSGIYSALGYSIPSGFIAPAPPNPKVRTPLFKSLFFKFAFTGVLSLLVGVGATYFIMNKSNKTNIEYGGAPKPATRLMDFEKPYQYGMSAAIPKRGFFAGTSENERKLGNIGYITYGKKDIYIEREAESAPETATIGVDRNSLRIEFIEPSEINIQKLYLNGAFGSLEPNAILQVPVGDFCDPPLVPNKNVGIIFEARNSINWNLPKETIAPHKFNKLNNMEFSALYALSERFAIGGEVKQETFYQEYAGAESDGHEYKYFQQANYTTFGGKIRFYPLEDKAIRPYAQLCAGFNVVGYVFRPSLGTEVNITDRMAFIAGGEYSYFQFQHLNKKFDASKISVNYGFAYKW